MFILQNIGICFQQNFNAWNFPFFFTSKWYSLKSVANVGREFSDVINILIFLLSIYGHLYSRDWYDIECQFGLHYFENKWSGSFGLSLFNFYNWLVYLYIFIKQGIGLKMSSELFKVEKMASCPVYGRTKFLAFLRYYFFG
jgi:hypothetical protein